MYLLDTDVVINYLRGESTIPESIIYQSQTAFMCYSELLYGAFKSRDPQENFKKVQQFLQDYQVEILGFTVKLGFHFGKLKAQLERKGQRLPDADLLIAATALSNNLKLITHNTKHFERIPKLRIYGN